MAWPPERLESGAVVCVCVFKRERERIHSNSNTLFCKTRSASNVSLVCFSKFKDPIPQIAKKSIISHLSRLPPLALLESWDLCSVGDMEEMPGFQSTLGSLL